MHLILLAILLAVAAMGVFIFSLVSSLRGSREKKNKDIEPVVSTWPPGSSQLEIEQLRKETTELQARLAGSQQQAQKLATDNVALRQEIEVFTRTVAENEIKARADDSAPKERVRELEQQLSIQEAHITRLNDALSSNKNELENTIIKNQAFQAEFQEDRKKSEAFIEENEACKAQAVAQQEENEKLKMENGRLNKELDEQLQKGALLEMSNTPRQDDSGALAAKIEEYNKEIAKLNDSIADLRKKEDLAGLISKEEYDQVKGQINEKESVLSRLKGELEGIKPHYLALQADLEQGKKNEAQLTRKLEELKKEPQDHFPAEIAYLRKKLNLDDGASDKDVLVNTIEALEDSLRKVRELEKQLQVCAALSPQQDSVRSVSEDEYIKIKQKLEAAEKILRLIHGAG